MKKECSEKRQGSAVLSSLKGRFCFWVVCGLALFALDAGTKMWINHLFADRIALGGPTYPYGGIGVFQRVLGIDFCLHRVTNRGGAWGVFASHPYVLLSLRLSIWSGLLAYALFVNRLRSRDFPFLLILVGASGNLCDFFYYGHVIDFLHFDLWGYSFPVFNGADTMIFCGVALYLLQLLWKKDEPLSLSNRTVT